MGEEKWRKQTPHEIKKILGVAFTEKMKILQIVCSSAEFLDFDFLILNFFLKTGYNFNLGTKFKTPPW